MVLQNLNLSRFLLLIGAFLVFAIAAPNNARADTCDSQGDFDTAYTNTLNNVAGRLTNVRADYLKRAVTLDIDHYCIPTIIKAIDDIKLIMIGMHGAYAIINLLADAILQAIIGLVCGIATQFVQIATSLLTSQYLNICLPLPQLHLGLNFSSHQGCFSLFGGTSTALKLTPVGQMGSPPVVPSAPNYWNIWGTENKATGSPGGGFDANIPTTTDDYSGP